jgi:hypothetical protein
MWSGQFWANYNPVFSIEIIISVNYYYYYYYYVLLGTLFSQRSFTLALSNDFIRYYTKDHHLDGLDSWVIRTTPDYCIMLFHRINGSG